MHRDELKPCPFCGGKPSIRTFLTESLWSHDQVTYTAVGCGECEIEFSSEPGYEIESPEAWNRRAALFAVLSEQALPVRVEALKWDEFSTTARRHFQSNTILGQFQVSYLGEFECWQLYSPQKSDSWKENFSRHASPEAAKAAAQSDYETRIRSALVDNSHASEAVVETWQPIETAPKDGTPIDLWGVNHLHPAKTGRRATNVTWGRVRDWMGNERDDWQHGHPEDFEPTHWMPLPAPPALSSLRPAEVGSATSSTGTGGGE